jgi:NAD(P)-dependent dehydrogenase (short-subunit alcohol dehydrogenase family)
MTELEGRVALVTGAGRGIGAAIAESLARAGALVILADRAFPNDQPAMDGSEQVELDVTNEDGWRTVIADITVRHGRLDILVNNAGIYLLSAITETSLDDWRRVQSVNVEGVFLGCKHAMPLLAETAKRLGHTASIINMSSTAGLVGAAGGAAYGASKGAVRLLTKSVALEGAAFGIRANSVHPAIIETAMGQQVIDAIKLYGNMGANQARAEAAQLQPLARLGEPRDIAECVLFLASDRSRFMTGSELVVDGGFTAR